MNTTRSYKVKLVNINDAVRPTLELYRQAVAFLIEVVHLEWDSLEHLSTKGRVNQVEKFTHRTTQNPVPTHDFDGRFYKFPSYLRRSAISDAVGTVSSYMSNLANYEAERHLAISNGQPFKKKAPRLSYKNFKCPALYKGNMYQPVDDGHVRIKVFKQNDWVWLDVSLRRQDVNYIKRHITGTEKAYKSFSPVLVQKGRNTYLQFAFETPVDYIQPTKGEERVIVAVDLGLNHSAVCSAMRPDGTVIGRSFIDQPIEKDRLTRHINRLCKKQAQSGRFAKQVKTWNRINHLKDEITNRTVHAIVAFALAHRADTIVFEYLDRFQKIKGKKNKRIRMRLQLWAKITIQQKVRERAQVYGIRFSRVSARNTSRLAYDGSGVVNRSKTNASNSEFTNGRRYNSDLNASYNIGSRYYLRELEKSTPEKAWSAVLAKVPELLRRTQCTLSTLWQVRAVL